MPARWHARAVHAYNHNVALPAGNYSSQLGTTRTLPAVGGARRQIRLAQQSCVNWRFGFWHVYNITAQIQDVDAVVFLGVSTAIFLFSAKSIFLLF